MNPTAEIIRLRDELDLAKETILQLRQALAPRRYVEWRGIDLTWTEYATLTAFVEARGLLTEEKLRARVDAERGRTEWSDSRSATCLICRLRKKLHALEPPIAITNVKGFGYRLDEKAKAALAARVVCVQRHDIDPC